MTDGGESGQGPEVGGEVDEPQDETEEFDVADLGMQVYEQPSAAPPRNFKPWHRPRKQYVRDKQWVACATELVAHRDATDGVKYLGLPGTDLLDLRAFYRALCVPTERVLTFLGFVRGSGSQDEEGNELAISLQELKQTPRIHERSMILADDFSNLSRWNSQAYQTVRDYGPFDIVNLDLCESVAGETPGLDATMYDALARLLALQARHPHPWLLLLTTRLDRGTLDEAAAGILLDHLNQAHADCPDLCDACAEWLDTANVPLSFGTASDKEIFFGTALGFCAWIFDKAQAIQHTRINVRQSFSYQVNPTGAHADMLSIAIRFSPVIVVPGDPAGLANKEGDADPVDRCKVVTQAGSRLTKTVDVDQLLAANPDVRATSTEQAATLLEEARYSADEYREWAGTYTS